MSDKEKKNMEEEGKINKLEIPDKNNKNSELDKNHNQPLHKEALKDKDITEEKPDGENLEDEIDVESPEDETDVESPEDEVERLRDEKLRLLAEMENLRKRSSRDKIDSIRYGSINLARDMLSPDDNLTRALDAIPQEEKNSVTVSNLIDGLKMVQKEFSSILEKYGVKKIEALNKKFDHNFHQAMVEIENGDVEAGIVVQEMQSGYTMYDRLLRPSMVGVSKKPSKNQDEEVVED